MDRDPAFDIDRVLAAYERPLLRYVENLIGCPASARDVVQDALLQLIRGKWRSGDLGAWLYTVCRNRALDYLKKESRMIPLASLETTAPPPDPAANPEQTLHRRDTSARMTALIAALPTPQREVVHLKFAEGKTYAQIADLTGHSVASVGFLLHTALKTLRGQHPAAASSQGGAR